MLLRSRLFAALLNSALLAFTAHAQTIGLQQRLREKFENKVLALRGFLSGDQLSYDAAGSPVGIRPTGFWTMDGFVLITDVKAYGQTVVLKGRRMPVVAAKDGFHFQADSEKKRKRMAGVEIEARLGPGDPAEELDAVAAKIFLTEHDSLVALVPSYWQTCVSAGLNQVNDPKFAACTFTAEMLSIPGMNPHADLRAVAKTGQPNSADQTMMHVFRVGNDISPPRVLSQRDPQFSSFARDFGLHGTEILQLIVDDQGLPQNIEIQSPLGGGLDEEAVAAITTWKFKPAEQKGHGPVAVKIAVEVEFLR